MQVPSIDARAIAQSGIAALRSGDATGARKSFEIVVNSGLADASTYLGLAYACAALGDMGAALNAVNVVLAGEPDNLRALVFKADRLADAGDARSAASFYRALLRAAAPPAQVPADLLPELVRAQSQCDRYAQDFENYLQARLAEKLAGKGASTKRFAHSLDLLCGKKTIYFQEPKNYYFPELPQIQFYENGMFPWLARVEAATDDIRAELHEILREPSVFVPYVQAEPNRPVSPQAGMLDNPDWSAFYLWKNGAVIADNAARCPRTMAALEGVPFARVPGRSPSILFSLLRPGARIPPHHGFVNTRLIGHLPLIVPAGCGFRVGNETREWEEGKAWLFDDTIEHEAWNLGKETRVILLFEIWRPELTDDERAWVSAMFEAIDQHGSGPAAWNF